MDNKENNEELQEKKIKETEIEAEEAIETSEENVEDTQDDTQDERTDDEQRADEEEDDKEIEADSDEAEHKEEGERPDEVEEEHKEEETAEEQTKEEEVQEELPKETIEDLKRQLEEYKTAEQDKADLSSIQNLTRDVVADVQKFENIIQEGMIAGLKQFGIDPDMTFEQLAETDPAKFEIAKQLVEEGNRRIQEHRAKAKAILDEQGSNLVFKRAERAINKYGLSKEQAVAAAETFVNIYMNVGVADLEADLDAKVRLAVGQAKMDVPDEVKEVEDTSDTTKTDRSDTTISKEPSVQNDEQPKEEVKEEPDNTPVQEVDIDEYKEGATDTSAKETSTPNKDAVTPDNVLQKLAALPYRERVAFMLEHQAEYEEAMNRRI